VRFRSFVGKKQGEKFPCFFFLSESSIHGLVDNFSWDFSGSDMIRCMKKSYKTISVVVLIGMLVGVASVAFQKVQGYIAEGIKDSQKLRFAESNVCDPTNAQKPHFGGCSSIL